MPGTLEEIVAAHPRIHTAEGCLYRDSQPATVRRTRGVMNEPGSIALTSQTDATPSPAVPQPRIRPRGDRDATS